MNLVLFGPPGSGKGTQAERLRDRFRLRHISTGDLLREAVAQKSELGKKVESVLASGHLVSDDIVLALMRDAILGVKKNASLSGWLLDGFPRTVGQAIFTVSSMNGVRINPDSKRLSEWPTNAF